MCVDKTRNLAKISPAPVRRKGPTVRCFHSRILPEFCVREGRAGRGNRINEGQFDHSYTVSRDKRGWGGAFSGRKSKIIHLFCVGLQLGFVKKHLKNRKKTLKLKQIGGQGAPFGSFEMVYRSRTRLLAGRAALVFLDHFWGCGFGSQELTADRRNWKRPEEFRLAGTKEMLCKMHSSDCTGRSNSICAGGIGQGQEGINFLRFCYVEFSFDFLKANQFEMCKREQLFHCLPYEFGN